MRKNAQVLIVFVFAIFCRAEKPDQRWSCLFRYRSLRSFFVRTHFCFLICKKSCKAWSHAHSYLFWHKCCFLQYRLEQLLFFQRSIQNAEARSPRRLQRTSRGCSLTIRLLWWQRLREFHEWYMSWTRLCSVLSKLVCMYRKEIDHQDHQRTKVRSGFALIAKSLPEIEGNFQQQTSVPIPEHLQRAVPWLTNAYHNAELVCRMCAFQFAYRWCHKFQSFKYECLFWLCMALVSRGNPQAWRCGMRQRFDRWVRCVRRFVGSAP